MKFGQRIRTSLYHEWSDQYLDYNGLKRDLKDKSGNGNQGMCHWEQQDENAFVKRLEKELVKCEQFQVGKATELSSKISSLEHQVMHLVESYDGSAIQLDPAASTNPTQQPSRPRDPESGNRITKDTGTARRQDAGSDDEDSDAELDSEDEEEDSEDERLRGDDDDAMSEASFDEKFKELEEEVATLVADVHDLALYTKLNFTGFVKIVKKHDKVTGFNLKSYFNAEYLDKHPFYKYNYDGLIVKLSRLFDLVRTRGHPIEGDAAAGGSQNAFVRSTTKYWVHEDNIVHLKLAILKQLPVLVFNSAKEFDIKDSAITSIYFDNEELELYLGRLEKTEGAEAIRLRWYGDVTTKTIFVERKTHREDWTGEKSVKARFGLQEHKVNDFIAGRLTMDAEFDELVAKGKKTAKEVESMKQLANEVQYAILTRKLKPVMRSFYNRTAFQLPGDARVRISLDTELTMVREDDFDSQPRAGTNWRRTDIGIDFPFDGMKNKKDKEVFPYAVLEVKLQTQMGQEPPTWVTDLVHSNLVTPVPKFSKFIHGCATLLPERVELIPFWQPQMDQDIRRPADPETAKKVAIERPHSANVSSGSGSASVASPAARYEEPVSEGEDDEYLIHTSHNEAKRLNLPPEVMRQAQLASAEREQKLKEEAAKPRPESARRDSTASSKTYGPRLDIDPLQPSRSYDKNYSLLDPRSLQKLFKAKSQQRNQEPLIDEEDEDDEEAPRPAGNGVEYTRVHAPASKRIAIPVRIEPKVIFANERTFLKWLHFGILIGGIATALLNFIDSDDRVGLIAAGMFTFTALLAIAYAAGMYTWRVFKLRRRDANNYHDPYGPTILCAVLITSILVNLVLKLRQPL